MKKQYVKPTVKSVDVQLANPIADSYVGSWAEECAQRAEEMFGNSEEEDQNEDR